MQFVETSALAPERITGCLRAVEARDHFVAEADLDEVLESRSFVALDGADEAVGVGWTRPAEGGMKVDVRVLPAARRKGIGSELLRRIVPEDRTLLASCDAGHPRSPKFLQKRGFHQFAVVFHQRWDGDVEDVPGAFRTAEIRDEPDIEAAWVLLDEAASDAWPPPAIDAYDLTLSGAFAVTAWRNDERIGVMVGREVGDVLALDGVAVKRVERRSGVGRALLCHAMRRAATDGLGVTLRTDQADDTVLEWTRALGFWTFRAWSYFRR
jgi:GNAT superfamily N-acetyltransferase